MSGILGPIFGNGYGVAPFDQGALQMRANYLSNSLSLANVPSICFDLLGIYNQQRNLFAPDIPAKPLDERFADFKRRLDIAVAKRRRK